MTKRFWIMCSLLCLVINIEATDYKSYYKDLPTEVKAVEAVVIPQNEINLKDVGGVGDGVTLCTEAFEKGLKRLTEQGGGRLTIPEGVWLTGPITLKSNTELHLERNTIVVFSPDKRLYLEKNDGVRRVQPCIHASKQKNIAITGQGVIDGNGQQWRPVKRLKSSNTEWERYLDMGGQVTEKGDLWYPWQMASGYPDIADDARKQEGMRNDLIRLSDCQNILIEGVTIQNAPRFHVHPCFCENIIIDGITVRSEWNVQNADGIDLSDCRQALIVNSTVSVGDDGICLKSNKPTKGRDIAGCEDMVIMHNTVNHAHGGFVLGSEIASGIRRIVVRNNTFSGTDIGLRFKSSLGRGGRTEALYISNIMMNDIAGEAIAFQCDYVNRQAGDNSAVTVFTDADRQWAPQFQDIHINNVVCYNCKTGIKAKGIKGLECVKNINISNCTIVYSKNEHLIDQETAQLLMNNVKLLRLGCSQQ